jgi:hypothetical protein
MVSKTAEIYPYCYKIKEDCPPCDNDKIDNNCIYFLAKYLAIKSNRYADKSKVDNAYMNIVNCLQKYGDMYKKVGIELYVNPKTNQILFPDIERILSNYNLFLNEIGLNDTTSSEENDVIDNKIKIYQILLNDNLREIYNNFYKSSGFSELESIMPKEYGISRILNQNFNNITGGKRRKVNNKRKTNNKRIMNNRWKTRKIKRIKKCKRT